jgi:hypothetical protein
MSTETISRTRTKWLLWLAGALLLPLPYLFLQEGAVPVVRYAFLAVIAAGYAAFVDGSEVAWPMTFIVAVHAGIYALLLYAVAGAAARFMPERRRKHAVVTAFALGFTVALLFPIYATPMDDEAARSSWIGLFQ